MKNVLLKISEFFYYLIYHRRIINALEAERDEWGKDFFDQKVLKLYAEGSTMQVKFEAPVFKYFAWGIADAYEAIGPENYVGCDLQVGDDRTGRSYELSIRKIGRGQSMANKNADLVRQNELLTKMLKTESEARIKSEKEFKWSAEFIDKTLSDLANLQARYHLACEGRDQLVIDLANMQTVLSKKQNKLKKASALYNQMSNWKDELQHEVNQLVNQRNLENNWLVKN